MSGDAQIAKLNEKGGQGVLSEAPIDLITRVLFGERYSSKKNKVYLNAFYLDDTLIKELDERARELITKQPIMPGSSLHFMSVVRFDDNSSQDFIDLTRMLKRSADERDPESVVLTWKALIYGHGSMISCIEATFITEKKMKTGSVGAFDFSVASMQLEVYSADEEWVEAAFAKTKGIFKSARLPWLYAPLLIFRNTYVVQIVANGLAMSGFFVFWTR